jgi:hypothetical protein
VAIRFQRLYAPESSLDGRQYTVVTESRRPALCCPWCLCVFPLPAGVALDHAGRSSHAVKCPQAICAFWDWVELESVWEDP